MFIGLYIRVKVINVAKYGMPAIERVTGRRSKRGASGWVIAIIGLWTSLQFEELPNHELGFGHFFPGGGSFCSGSQAAAYSGQESLKDVMLRASLTFWQKFLRVGSGNFASSVGHASTDRMPAQFVGGSSKFRKRGSPQM